MSVEATRGMWTLACLKEVFAVDVAHLVSLFLHQHCFVLVIVDPCARGYDIMGVGFACWAGADDFLVVVAHA